MTAIASAESPQRHEPLLTARQVAGRLGVDRDTVRRWARKDAISHVHVGPYRLLRFREADVQAAIRDHLGHSEPDACDSK